MPRGAVAFAVVRPAAILKWPDPFGLAKLLDEGTRIGIPAQEIGQFTWILLSPAEKTSEAIQEAAAAQDELNIFQTTKPSTFADWRRRMPELRMFNGKMYSVDHSGIFQHAVHVPNDRTLVWASSERAMQRYLRAERAGKGLPTFVDAKLWEQFRADHAVAAAQWAFVPWNDLIMKVPPDSYAMSFLWRMPLQQAATSIIGGIQIGDETRVHAVMLAKDQASVDKVEGAAQGIRALLSRAGNQSQADVELVKKAAGHGLAPADAFQLWAHSLMEPLAGTMRIDRDGLVVRLQSTLNRADVQKASVAPRASDLRMQSINNLKQLGIAMNNYLDAMKHFPPAVLHKAAGSPPYSWRVALLPFMGEEGKTLHQQYRFDEPWDGPNNRKLLDKMPWAFRCPMETSESTNTSYFALVGPGTMFDATKPSASESRVQSGGGGGGVPGRGGPASVDTTFDGTKGARLADIADGTSFTIMLVETKRDIPWTKPEDIPYDPDKPLPKLGGYFEDGFHVVMAYGTVHFLPYTVSEKILRAHHPGRRRVGEDRRRARASRPVT